MLGMADAFEVLIRFSGLLVMQPRLASQPGGASPSLDLGIYEVIEKLQKCRSA
jgi:hypothetical protein